MQMTRRQRRSYFGAGALGVWIIGGILLLGPTGDRWTATAGGSGTRVATWGIFDVVTATRTEVTPAGVQGPTSTLTIDADPKAMLATGIGLALVVVSGMMLFRRGTRNELVGRCDECGYDLRGTDDGRCPECGSTTPSP